MFGSGTLLIELPPPTCFAGHHGSVTCGDFTPDGSTFSFTLMYFLVGVTIYVTCTYILIFPFTLYLKGKQYVLVLQIKP